MAMMRVLAKKRPLTLWAALLAALSAPGACRDASICADETACLEPRRDESDDLPGHAGTAGAGAEVGSGGSELSGGGAPSPVANDVSAGVPGAAGDAGASAGASSTCPPRRADCDGSSLTVCEASLDTSFRNCGACGSRCDGACVSGRCKPYEELGLYDIEALVASKSSGFALVLGDSLDLDLLRIDLTSGGTEVIAEGIPEDVWGTELTLGDTRLYASFYNGFVSLNLDGSGRSEESLDFDSFGASRAGAYYTDWEADQYRLWFRSETSPAFELIFESSLELFLAASAPSGVVMVQGTAPEPEEYFLLKEKQVLPLGPVPPGTIDQVVVGEGLVTLAVPSSTEPNALTLTSLKWNASSDVRSISASLAFHARLVPAPNGAALLLADGADYYVGWFDANLGSFDIVAGIQSNTRLHYSDHDYIWYTWSAAPDAVPRFVRAPPRQFSDLDPN